METCDKLENYSYNFDSNLAKWVYFNAVYNFHYKWYYDWHVWAFHKSSSDTTVDLKALGILLSIKKRLSAYILTAVISEM